MTQRQKARRRMTKPLESNNMHVVLGNTSRAIISIIVALTLLFSLLFTVFTDEIDTYICYVTETGECYHASTCHYLRSRIQTTVYEAEDSYRSCSKCDPCVERYKTTITVRNYQAAIFSGIGAGAFVYVSMFYLLVFLENQQRKKEDI